MSGIKTFSNETSERYASALFELASENSEIEDVEQNIILLLKTLNDNVDFKNFLKNPTSYGIKKNFKQFFAVNY